MSTHISLPTNLFSILPFDILAILCKYIKFDDVKRMRLTSRETCSKFNEYFARQGVIIHKLNSKSNLFTIMQMYAKFVKVSNSLGIQLATSFRNVNILSFYSTYNEELPEELTQLVNLETVIFQSTSRFNKPIDILGSLPNLKKLVFGYYFNQSIEPLRTAIKLESICFGTEFYQPIDALEGLGLKSLIFGGMSHFNLPIDCISKMRQLKYLCFCGYFNQDITPLCNLENLRELKFGIYFDQPVDNLASLVNLEKLVFTGNFNQSIDSLVTLINLRFIRFGTKFNQPVDALAHMEFLEEIAINNSEFSYGRQVLEVVKVLPLLEHVTISVQTDGK